MKDFCTNKMCTVKAQCLWEYNEAVQRSVICPLKDAPKKSVQEILECPGFVSWQAKIPEGPCFDCKKKLSGADVKDARDFIMDEFWDGLCLDCMDITNPKTGDIDEDYWIYNARMEWDANCRIDHEQRTWYWSFMGRPSIMSKYQQEQRARKAEARGY